MSIFDKFKKNDESVVETPPVVETETPPVVETETPPVVETETPPVVEEQIVEEEGQQIMIDPDSNDKRDGEKSFL